MKNNKKMFFVLTLFILSISILSGLTHAEFSEQTSGIAAYGFDQNQTTHISMGTWSIWATDYKIMFYDSTTGTIDKSYNVVTPTGVYQAWTNTTKTAIMQINSTYILVVTAVSILNSLSSPTNGAGYRFIAGLLNVNNLAYTAVVASTEAGIQAVSGAMNPKTGLAIFRIINATYTTYGLVVSSICGAASTTSSGMYILGTYSNVGVWATSYAISGVSTTVNWVGSSAIVIPSKTTWNEFYLISGSYSTANKAQIYKMKIYTHAVTSLGESPNPTSWSSVAATTHIYDTGFVYLFGEYFYNGTTNQLYELNVAYSLPNTAKYGISTLVFNDTFIDNSNVLTWDAIATNSEVVRPFTITTPQNGGNVSGQYVTAIWTNANSITYGLTGFQYILSGIETATPTWTQGESFFIFTPQQPQVFNYTTSVNAKGYVVSTETVGVEINAIAPAQSGYSGNGYMVAQTFYPVNYPVTFNAVLNGGIFVNSVIDVAPTQIALQQGVNYIFTGNVYINLILSGNGTYSIGTTGLSLYSSIFSNYTIASSATGVITNGEFDFTISPISNPSTLYQVLTLNISLTDGTTLNYVYNLVYYPLGSSAYPTPEIGANGNINTSVVSAPFIGGLILLLVFGLIFGYVAGRDGALVGIMIAIFICSVTGIFPIFGLIIDVLVGGLLIVSHTSIGSRIGLGGQTQ